MNNIYDSKTVLITGSSRGIGAATAEKFAKEKYNIVINYISNKKAADELSEYLKEKYNINTLVIKCDVSKEEEVLNMLQLTKEKFNTIDVLVNNAAIALDTILEDKTVENFRRILDVNLIGTFLTSKHIGLFMKQQGYGSIVNVSSTNAIDSYYPYSMNYDASKCGVISLTHNFALEYAPTIRVNCIAPGWVNTDMSKDLDDEYRNEECSHIQLGRFAAPEEIANEIYHIAVESTYMNDSIIKVDGGKC